MEPRRSPQTHKSTSPRLAFPPSALGGPCAPGSWAQHTPAAGAHWSPALRGERLWQSFPGEGTGPMPGPGAAERGLGVGMQLVLGPEPGQGQQSTRRRGGRITAKMRRSLLRWLMPSKRQTLSKDSPVGGDPYCGHFWQICPKRIREEKLLGLGGKREWY